MTDEDERIGRNIIRFRGTRSQAEVAKEMRARGWKWAQNTVSAVETGERPLRFREAVDLASVLEVRDVGTFARQDEYVTFRLWARETYDAYRALIEATDRYEEAQVQLAVAGEEALQAGVPPTNDVVGLLKSWTTRNAVEAILEAEFDDEHDDARIRELVTEWREGRAERGANGPWMNKLFDATMRKRAAALELRDGEHQEAP